MIIVGREEHVRLEHVGGGGSDGGDACVGVLVKIEHEAGHHRYGYTAGEGGETSSDERASEIKSQNISQVRQRHDSEEHGTISYDQPN